MRKIVAFTAGLFIGLLLGSMTVAAKTGEHFWIQANPQYITDSGTHCCGDNHCRRITPGVEFVEVQGGLLFNNGQFFPFTRQGAYVSNEPGVDKQDWWACFWGGEWKCIFYPYTGS